MNIEQIRKVCLHKQGATEDFPFDETTLVFRIQGKIFACIDLEKPDWICLKCRPDYAIELRDRYQGIEGAWHWNKKHWNQVAITHTDVPEELVHSLIDHSYDEVVRKLPRRLRDEVNALRDSVKKT